MSVTLAVGTYVLTFRNGSFVVSYPSQAPQQIISESEDLTVRVATVSTNIKEVVRINMQSLQAEDEGAISGFNSLMGFFANTLEWMANTAILTDADATEFAVRYWSPIPFETQESPKNVFNSSFEFRVEI